MTTNLADFARRIVAALPEDHPQLSIRATEFLHALELGECHVEAFGRWLGARGSLESTRRTIDRAIAELRSWGFVVERANEGRACGDEGEHHRGSIIITRLEHPRAPGIPPVRLAAWLTLAHTRRAGRRRQEVSA